MKGFVPIYKLYVKCFGQTLFSYPYLCMLNKYKDVIKNNSISLVIHIIVCMPKTE